MPEANTLTIGILATIAQHERELIADRTKKALVEKKKRGFTLGTPSNLTEHAKRKGTLHSRLNAQADQNNRRAGAFAKKLRTLTTIVLRLQGNSMPMNLRLETGKLSDCISSTCN